MTPLTRDKANDSYPIWTPDGQRIIFGSEREGGYSIYWKAADDTGKAEQIASMKGGRIWPTSLSNDGNTLFLGQYDAEAGGQNIGMLSMEGDRTPKLLLQEEYTESDPQISPDGRWLAYTSNESGQSEVYIRPFPDVDSGKMQVSTRGGREPLWSPDGRELFYRNGLEAVAVPVETEPALRMGRPKILFQGPYLLQWDINPDGKRFLMISSPGADRATADRRTINIVLNWFEELKVRVPFHKMRG